MIFSVKHSSIKSMKEPENILYSVLTDSSEELSHKGHHTNHYRQYDFINTDTYQMVELKTALNSRKLRPYLKRIGIPESGTAMDSLNSYILGKRPLISSYVFMTRTAVQPAKWYFVVNEPLPEQINFTPKFTENLLREKETLGHEKLKTLIKLYSTQTIAEKYGFTCDALKNVLYKRKEAETGKMVFKTVPSPEIISAFRHVINPDFWFIFPEELKNSKNENKLSDFLINQVCNLLKEKYNISREEAFKRITKSKTYVLVKDSKTFDVNKAGIVKLPKIVLEMWESELVTGNPKASILYRTNIVE